jgi:hypothetical protein
MLPVETPAAGQATTVGGPVGVVVCRGCCCGSASKHPDVDHTARLEQLRRFAAAHPAVATVQTSLCLGPCEHADVIVVRPSPAGRRLGGRPVWFGLLDDHALDRLRAWVADGGPGIVAIPDDLELHQIGRPRTDARQPTPPRSRPR